MHILQEGFGVNEIYLQLLKQNKHDKKIII